MHPQQGGASESPLCSLAGRIVGGPVQAEVEEPVGHSSPQGEPAASGDVAERPGDAERRAVVGDHDPAEGTLAFRAYGRAEATERYDCEFGINPERLVDLTEAGLVVSGSDQDGEPRVVELPDHLFFAATLLVPQASSAPGAPHPLVRAFVGAAASGAG